MAVRNFIRKLALKVPAIGRIHDERMQLRLRNASLTAENLRLRAALGHVEPVAGVQIGPALIAPDSARLSARIAQFRDTIAAAKAHEKVDFSWYSYDSLGNFEHLQRLMGNTLEQFLGAFPPGSPVIDVGCADGETAFFLESLGFTVDAVDYPPTGNSGMRGLRHLKRCLNSNVRIIEQNLDTTWAIDGSYAFAFGLGVLYHLRNPFNFLDQFNRITEYLFVSTRIASHGPDRTKLAHLPVAYLLDAQELNNDATNYWIFTMSGMERLAERAGWDIIKSNQIGAVGKSYPHRSDADERLFMLLRRRHP
jgi:tRNA (mo5U34)-methyltransferase